MSVRNWKTVAVALIVVFVAILSWALFVPVSIRGTDCTRSCETQSNIDCGTPLSKRDVSQIDSADLQNDLASPGAFASQTADPIAITRACNTSINHRFVLAVVVVAIGMLASNGVLLGRRRAGRHAAADGAV